VAFLVEKEVGVIPVGLNVYSVNNLKSGIYLVKILTKEGIESKKLGILLRINFVDFHSSYLRCPLYL